MRCPTVSAGWVDSGLQEEPELEQAVDDRIQDFPAALCLLCRDRRTDEVYEVFELPGCGGIPDHGEGEVAGCGRDGGEADLYRERGCVFAQPDEPTGHRPGPGCFRVGGPVAAVGRLQVGWDQALDHLAEQVAVLVAEHLLQPSAGQRERAVAVCQRHPILEGVD